MEEPLADEFLVRVSHIRLLNICVAKRCVYFRVPQEKLHLLYRHSFIYGICRQSSSEAVG